LLIGYAFISNLIIRYCIISFLTNKGLDFYFFFFVLCSMIEKQLEFNLSLIRSEIVIFS